MMVRNSHHHGNNFFIQLLYSVFLCPMGEQLSRSQKKQWAKTLFVNENMEQKQIALTVGVSEKTIGTWKVEGKWESFRSTIITTKEEQLKYFYAQLNDLNKAISDRDEGKRHATNSESDTIIKITKSIKNLENEAGVAELISAYTKLVDHIRTVDFELAQNISVFVDDVIKSKLK